MSWFDNLWRRRQGHTPDTSRKTAEARAGEGEERKPDEDEADVLEERAHMHRTDEVFREPRIPPGTG